MLFRSPDQLRLPLLPPGTAPSPSHAELPPFTSAALKTARLCTRCFLCLECSLGFKPLTTTFQLERFLFSPLCVGHVKLPLQSCFWLPACWVSWPLLSEPPAPAWLLPLILMDFFSDNSHPDRCEMMFLVLICIYVMIHEIGRASCRERVSSPV